MSEARELSDNEYLFTSESVTEGHPDKIADQISDGVLDAVLTDDPYGRVACETLVNTGLVVVSGEISTETYVDIQEIARDTITRIGYTDADLGFSADSCAVISAIDKQSPDIAQGVDTALEARTDADDDDELDVDGAGDQGMMFGYATRETPGADAASDLARSPPRSPPRRGPQGRRGALPAARRQDPGDRALRERPADRDREDPDLDSAQGRRRHRHADPPRPLGARPPPDPARRALRRAEAEHQAELPRQPDRSLRHRGPGRRHRPHRPQDHRRHIRGHGTPRRRRLLGQGPVEGRPLGGLRRALGREERGRGRPRRPLRSPGGLRDRRRPPGLADGRDLRDREDRRARRSRGSSPSTSTFVPAPSARSSGSTGRSTRRRPPTATSAARTTTSPGSAPTAPTRCARPPAWARKRPLRPRTPGLYACGGCCWVGASAGGGGSRRALPSPPPSAAWVASSTLWTTSAGSATPAKGSCSRRRRRCRSPRRRSAGCAGTRPAGSSRSGRARAESPGSCGTRCPRLMWSRRSVIV